MKLKFTLLLIIAVAFASSFRAQAQNIAFTDNGTSTNVSGYSSDYDVAILDTLLSTYPGNKQVTWSIVKVSGPSQWSFTNCDPASCYSAQSPYNYLSNSNTITPWTIIPNANGVFTFHVILHNTAGSGTYRLSAWVDGDSVNTAVNRLFNINVTQATGFTKIASPEIKLYPIPANDILNVDLNNFNAGPYLQALITYFLIEYATLFAHTPFGDLSR